MEEAEEKDIHANGSILEPPNLRATATGSLSLNSSSFLRPSRAVDAAINARA